MNFFKYYIHGKARPSTIWAGNRENGKVRGTVIQEDTFLKDL